MKKTVIIGATTNPTRYSHMAALRLHEHGHEIVPMGIKQGIIADRTIINDRPPIADVDTVTLYLQPARQPDWYDYILNLRPKRIIFNPGTENPELEKLARSFQRTNIKNHAHSWRKNIIATSRRK